MKRHRKSSKTIHAGSAAGTLLLFAVLAVSSSHALPQSGSVVAGSATISQPSATSLNILQTSGNAIINWQGYSIGTAESVTYVQPNSNSIVLNRVTGVDPTRIYGLLKGNGQVWVINRNGLLVGSGATVQTGGFLASTMNITNDSFMSGAFKFTGTPGSRASIVNEGSITSADGRYVLLSAPTVLNSGSIIANKGKVHLASGDVITFSIDNGNLINVAVSGDLAAQAQGITNSGAISADGGQVVLTARVAGDALRNVVNNDGTIEAKSIIEKDGIIILDGGDHGITANSGTLDASGKISGASGGSVTILGNKVGLFAGSLVDVSGDAGGGTALIGGNFHGAGQEKNAAMTYVDKDAVVKADALGNGNGGSVAVWSDDATRFFGAISAKGGVHGGNGGFVEVSGKHSLTYAGLTNLEALQGATGTLLLDPDEITIVHGADYNITVIGSGPFSDISSGSGSFLSDSTINTQLATANVTVTTSTESITSNADVVIDTNSRTLTLDSAKNITLGGAFNDTGAAGTLNLKIGQAGNGGTMAFSSGAVVNTKTVNITGGSGSDTLTGPNAVNAWNIAGPNSTSLNGMNATGIESLVGGTGSDTFTLGSNVTSFNGSIFGGGGTDTLAATNGTNTWLVSAANSGTLNNSIGGATTFSGISNLAGGSGADAFTLGAGVSTTFNGSISGGAGTNSLAATNGTNAWQLSSANTGTLNNLTFSGIATLSGGSGIDTLACSSQTYLLDNTVTNKGSNGLVTSWTSIESLADTGAGIFKFGTAGGVTGSISAVNGTLDYSGHTAAVNVNLAGTGTTGISSGWSGITSIIGSAAANDTITGANQIYTLDNSTANKGSNGVATWSAMENLTDTASGTFNMGTGGSVSGNINGGTGGTLNYDSYAGNVTLNLAGSAASTTGIGGTWSKITTVNGNSVTSNTVTGANKTYTLDSSAPNKGSSGGITWTNFKNITDSGTGIFSMGLSGIITGNINGGTGGTLDFSSYGSPVTFNLGGSGTTGVSGIWSGITTVKGNAANSNTITGLNKTYTLNDTTANKGSDGSVTWTAFKNITDSGSGIFNMGKGGSVTGNLNGGTDGTLNYGSYTNNVTLNLAGTGTSGIGGSWSNIATVTGNTATANTVTGASKTYHLDNSTPNSGNNGTVAWTSFKNITDTGAGTFDMGTSGSVTGNLNGGNNGVINFGTYGNNVTLNLSGVGTTGIGGTLSGIATVTGNAANTNAVTGLNKSYTLDNSITNKGSSSGITWTAFKNITDTGTGTFNMGSSGNVTGNLAGGTSGTLNYGNYATPVVVDLAGTGTSGIGGSWSGITTVTGNSATSNTITGLNKIYTLDNSTANKGSDGRVTWTAFKNLTDTGSGAFNMGVSGSVTGNITGTNGTLNYGSYGSSVTLDLSGNTTTGIGGVWSGITTVTGNATNSNTVTGVNKTYNLDNSIANKGSAGTVTWTAFKNITDTNTGIFNMGTGGSVTGNINGGISGILNYGSYANNVTLDLSGSATTGIGGSWSNIASVIGNTANSNTVTGASKTYSLDNSVINKGSAGSTTWLAFNNITDTGTGIFNMGTGGSITGNLNGGINGKLDYSSYGGNVLLNLSGSGSTGIDGIWSGISTITGNAATTNTISGYNKTYHLTDINTGYSNGIFWSSFTQIADTGTGALATTGGQTFTLTGFDSGYVTSLLPGGFTGIGTLADTGAATFRFGATGSVSGGVSALNGTLDYSAGIAGPVAVDLTAKNGTGIGTNWSGIKNVIGSAASDTISGTGATYTLTAADAGNSGSVSWTSFENLNDSAAGIFRFGAGGSVTGNISALNGKLDYSAGITEPVAVNLTAKSGTGIGGTWDGITIITGSSASDTMGGTDTTYHLTAANAGNSNGVSWTSFEKIADTGTGTLATIGGQAYTLSGVNSGTVATLLPGGFSGIGNLSDSGAGTFRFGANGSITGAITALNGKLDYSAGIAGPVSVDLAAKSGTGIGGTWDGIVSITGSTAADTITSSDATYNLTAANAGNSGGVSWTSFENLNDTGAGIFRFTSTGSLSGNITATNGTLDYSGRGGVVTVNLLDQSGTGIGGTWSGINTLIGSAVSDTIASTGATYNLTATDAGNSGGVSWSSFERIADAGNGTIATSGGQTYTLTGTDSGNVATLLPGGFTGIANLTDSDAGLFRFGANGSVTGNISALNGTLDYSAGMTGPVTLDLSAHTATGIGGTWSGINAAIGSDHTADTITGSDQTFTLTGTNAGNNGTVSWTSFENIAASGTNAYIGTGGSLAGSIIDSGFSTTLQGGIQTGGDQIYNGAVTLADATTLTSTGSGAVTFVGTLDSDATPRDLTIATSGVTTFGGVVGASPLNSLTINAGGATQINGGSVTTSGAAGQVYNNSVVLGADTTINSGSGAITFAGTLDGAQALTLAAGTGDITFADAVGAATRLNGVSIVSAGNVTMANMAAASLTQIAGSGATILNGVVDTTAGEGVNITTTGSITDNGAIITTGNGPVSLSAGSTILINDAISSSGPITLTATAISEGSNGSLTTAGLLSTGSSSGQALTGNGNNAIASINAVNNGSGDIILTNSAAPLTITGISQSGGNLTITNSGEITSSGPLTVAGTTAITAAGQPITLVNPGNDFTGVVTLAGGATQLADVNNLAVTLNTTGPTLLQAGTNMTLSGVSTSTVTATAPGQVTLANPAASLLTITGDTIVGTMNNPSPLDLTTTTSQGRVSVALTGNQPFLNFVGDVTTNIKGLGTYNGTAVAGTELENFKTMIGLRAAIIASALTAATTEERNTLSRFDNYFIATSKDSIINDDEAIWVPETDPVLIDR